MNQLPENRLLKDNDTRWNSKYIMIMRVLAQWPAFDATCRSEAGSKNSLTPFSASEKHLLTSFAQTLRPLKIATETLEAEKVPTISTLLPVLIWLKQKLTSSDSNSSRLPISIRCLKDEMISVLETKMEFYTASADFWIASALDPRVSLLKFTREYNLFHNSRNITLL